MTSHYSPTCRTDTEESSPAYPPFLLVLFLPPRLPSQLNHPIQPPIPSPAPVSIQSCEQPSRPTCIRQGKTKKPTPYNKPRIKKNKQSQDPREKH
ncbi:hypothetical protein BU24DRAFT_419487 [Aaosphaeria arxii CBS 175.79]|uniref:Uncharacterized protein n=1 Tax=Aaosphaeria arxii CBS 175.79 TaxID=1450172 RepID=A0A6A5Y4D2_9PLEO|nr:uncharacterized protein BU24DRAFT_419487 [Aaosphaeria arxii CBS 175.79]KAF2019887.1 hypothetical protein BU24DRAFT_419487 [Aaosphaeria arxii CBS 175.79]